MGTNVIDLARHLLKRGGALESTESGERLDVNKIRAGLEEALRKSGENVTDVEAKSAAASILTNGTSALQRDDPRRLSDAERSSLEAIIYITGRPAIRYVNGLIDRVPTALGQNNLWISLIATSRRDINEASAKIGRISIDAGSVLAHVGTAWMLRDDLAVTNRHVAEALVADATAPRREWRLDSHRNTIIDFAATDGTPAPQRFRIAELAYCDASDDIDLAVLRIDARGGILPAPLTLDWDRDVIGDQVYVVGHPYQSATDAVRTVFGQADGLKRWAPGFATKWAESEALAFEHDCSTLRGNSGSCVLTASMHEVVGLHYGGLEVNDDMRGRANAALALAKLTQGPARAFLRPAEN